MHIKGNSLLHDKCTESNFYFNETIIIDRE